MNRFLISVCVACVFTSPGFAQDSGMKIQTLPEKYASKTSHLNRDFLLYTPEESEVGKPWPLLIFLHGRGERGSDINRVKKHGPPKQIARGETLPFLMVAPQCLVGEHGKGWWRTNDLEELLAFIKATAPVDPKRMYLTGLSMGGFGTWSWAAEHPNTFAAVAPVCGGGNPAKAARYGTLPIWAFHGDKDQVVPLQMSKRMVDAVQAAGGNAKLTVYRGVGHDSWTKTYANSELYTFLLSHTK